MCFMSNIDGLKRPADNKKHEFKERIRSYKSVNATIIVISKIREDVTSKQSILQVNDKWICKVAQKFLNLLLIFQLIKTKPGNKIENKAIISTKVKIFKLHG